MQADILIFQQSLILLEDGIAGLGEDLYQGNLVELMRAPSRYLTGAILVLTGILLVAGSLALHSWGSKTVVTSSGIAPPLSSAERATLVRDGSTVSALPRALGEVTEAMSDAARSASGSPLSPTRAGDLLFEQPELTPLLHAVEHPRQVADGPPNHTSAPALGA